MPKTLQEIAVVDFVHPLCRRRKRKPLPDRPYGRLCNPMPRTGVSGQPEELFGQLLDIARLKKQPGLTIPKQFGITSDAGGDARAAASHGLHERVRQSLRE